MITCLNSLSIHFSLQLLLVQIQVRRGVGISCEQLNIMRVLMIVWIVGAVGLCQGSLGRENTTRTSYSDRNYNRNSLNNGNGQNGIRSEMKWALDCT